LVGDKGRVVQSRILVITDPGYGGPVPIIDAASLQHKHAYSFNLIPYSQL